MRRRTILYSGQVQGVGFRWTASRALEDLELTGFVRNLRDGRVQLVAEADPQVLDRAQRRVREALRGYIADEQAEDSAASGDFARFEIRR